MRLSYPKGARCGVEILLLQLARKGDSVAPQSLHIVANVATKLLKGFIVVVVGLD